METKGECTSLLHEGLDDGGLPPEPSIQPHQKSMLATATLLLSLMGLAAWSGELAEPAFQGPTASTSAATDSITFAAVAPSISAISRMPRLDTASSASKLAASSSHLPLDVITASSWYIYKITASIRPGTDLLLMDFVNRYLLPDAFGMESVGCNSTHLGGDYKVNFTATGSSSTNNQIHWVNGPILNGADVAAEWVEKILMATVGTTKSRAGMGLVYDSDAITSNAFMHNKVQFYVPSLDLFAKKLDEAGVVHLRRKSTVPQSASDATRIEMGHLSIPIEAKTYEIVGPLKSLSDVDSSGLYEEWSMYECPSCHHLAEDFETIQSRYYGTKDTTTWVDSDTGKVDGRPQPMLVSVHVAVSTAQKLDMMRTDFVHLRDYTHAKWELSTSKDGACNVASLSWDSMPGIVIKYVQNNHDDLPYRMELQEYEKTWEDEYEKAFFKKSKSHELPSSANWHHFLDTHIGITGTQGDDGGYCDDVFASLSEGLRDSGTGFATRDESDEMHLYVGYKATTAWEYNLATGCSSDVSFGDICGCVAENSVNVYNRRMDTEVDSCPKPCWAVDDDNDCGI